MDKDKNILSIIECDGPQHKKPIYGNEKFKSTQERDKIKNDFCKKENIPLLRIDTEYTDEESFKLIKKFLSSTTIEIKKYEYEKENHFFKSRVEFKANVNSKYEH